MDINVAREKEGKSRGFAFLSFMNSETIEMICQKEHKIDNCIVNCRLALDKKDRIQQMKKVDNQERKVFIKDVPLTISKNQLREHFNKFGEVEEVQLIVREFKKRGFAYILFQSAEALPLVLSQKHKVAGKASLTCLKSIPKAKIGQETKKQIKKAAKPTKRLVT